MDTQEAYDARLEAQMRAADARIEQMEAQARARHAQAEMEEISGLRARRDQLREQLAVARKELGSNWEALRGRVDAGLSAFRRSVSESYNRFNAWDDARERRFNAHLDEAAGALRESGAKDAELAASLRAGLAEAQEELQNRVAAARSSYDAWRERRADAKLQAQLDESELELDEAANRYAAALERVSKRGAERSSS